MEIHDFALKILTADSLEEKLFFPDSSLEAITDNKKSPPLLISEPTRPQGMGFKPHVRRKDKLPPFHELQDRDKRAICLHRFAGHELLAVEMMAYALLAFPEAPSRFRRGLLHTLKEEQIHVRLYADQMATFGMNFGDLPLYKHFWCYTSKMVSPIQYVSCMSLTFEMANLDFAPMYGKAFERAGDTSSAQLMAKIAEDEISHVSFGYQWFKKLGGEEVDGWDTWIQNLPLPLTPKRAKGFLMYEASRKKAGLPDSWIKKLSDYK